MTLSFEKATKKQAKLRTALIGPSGSGKTYTALRIAEALVPGGKIAVLDTERGSSALYADDFDFLVAELTDNYHPNRFVEAIHDAEAAGIDVLIIDSLSHEWNGPGGCLELVDTLKAKYKGNQFPAWGEVTPLHNRVMDTINASTMHIIATMRSKMQYVLEEDDKGKTKPVKLGMGPIQRDGAEYEFGIIGELDHDNTLVITKTRCSALTGSVFPKAGPEIAAILKAWLTDGAEMPITKAESTEILEYGKQKYGLSFDESLKALNVKKMSQFTDKSKGGYVATGKAILDAFMGGFASDQPAATDYEPQTLFEVEQPATEIAYE